MKVTAGRARRDGRVPSGIVTALTLAVSGLVVLFGWVLASPPGSSPDDPYHLSSIWCAEGFKPDICVEAPGAPDLSRVLVPRNVIAVSCFQADGTRSAACASSSLTPGPRDLISVTTSNIRRERPNLYYRAMHPFVQEDLGAATARMRTANVLVVFLMVGLSALIATPRIRIALLISSVVVSVPLGLFLMTSLNTAAWGLAGLTTLWANALTALTHTRTRNRLAGAALVVVGATLGLGSRTEAVGHIAVIAVTVAILWWTALRPRSGRERTELTRNVVLRRALIATGGALALLAVVLNAPQTAGIDRITQDVRAGHDLLAARGIGNPFLAISFEVPSLWYGSLGHVWGLGALDIPIPSLATLPLIGVFATLLVLGLQGAARPRLIAVGFVAFSLYAFPTLSLIRAARIVFEELQPRQFMVLLYLVVGIALLRLNSERDFMLGPAMRITLISILSFAHAVSLLVTMRRHVSGLVEMRYVSFSSDIEWWWLSGPSPNVVWAIGSIAYVVLIATVLRMVPTVPSEPAPVRS